MTLADAFFTLGNMISACVTALTLGVLGHVQIKRIKHVELREVVRSRKQFKNAVIGVSICFFCFAITNLIG
jgi:hypothetical protein